MTPDQIKELYETGEWICVRRRYRLMISEHSPWKIVDTVDVSNVYLPELKLIHKKHSDELDHVLNGGVVINHTDTGHPYFQDLDEFIEDYQEWFTYEIIKDNPSLNDHYCLATKEHYDKLVEDGVIEDEEDNIYTLEESKYIDISSGKMVFCPYDSMLYADSTPMHLHNKEWVKGSLEHEEME